MVIFDGKEKKTIKVDDIDERQTLKQSSMPEGQVGDDVPGRVPGPDRVPGGTQVITDEPEAYATGVSRL